MGKRGKYVIKDNYLFSIKRNSNYISCPGLNLSVIFFSAPYVKVTKKVTTRYQTITQKYSNF
jgi:hypothetical protein